MIITNHNYFRTFLFLSIIIHLLLRSRHVIGRMRCFENERQALLKFKQHIIDDSGLLWTWEIEANIKDCCEWGGVRCHNRTNHVTRLDLRAPSENGYWNDAPLPLRGKMISPSLLELQHLSYLDLTLNHFSGAPIPEFIGSIAKLRYLNLDSANIGGPIPHQIGNLSKLQYLNLDHNWPLLYSKDLEWLSHLHDLEYLNLNSVNLSMATNWLLAISKLNSIKELHLQGTEPPELILPSSFPLINTSVNTLAVLDLSWNQFISSSTFHWFLNFSSSLITFIDLSFSEINGTIPDAFDNMMSLEYLDLSHNSLEGGIPKSFGNMSSLIHLDLSRNRLSGSFPDVACLSSSKELRPSGNQLKGYILKKCFQLPNLVVLDLSFNNLTGPLPDFSFCSSLKELNLGNNKFNETLSKSIGGLSKLEYLRLDSNLLEGVITEDHLFNLSRLQNLDLSSNSLLKLKFSHQWVPPFQLKYARLESCELGPQFSKWIRDQKELIHLDISNARISDRIPTWFAYLSIKLEYLNASNNQIIDSFPKITHNWPRSTYGQSSSDLILDLSRNSISGSVTFLCDYPDLQLVDLSDNQLSNKLPECFANWTRLEYLNLANNNFSGKIPDLSDSLDSLSWLHLRNNSFSGGIPTSMKNCSELLTIDLGENKLTGKIPSWMGYGFPYLALLSLRSNEFLGSIPSSICGLQTLQILDFSSNNISGPIPKCLSNLTTMTTNEVSMDSLFAEHLVIYDISSVEMDLTSSIVHISLDSAYFMWKGTETKYVNNLKLVKLLDLSNNSLAGEIPPEIMELDGLIGLNLSRNNLIRSIPQNIGELKNLDFLDLSRNQLSGGIPTRLSELSYLGTLNLSYNNLSGRIPKDSHMLTFEESAYAGNPGLCGRPLNKSCPGDTNKSRQHSNFNQKDEDEDKDDDKLINQGFYIALGVGFVIGFWGIFGTILFNKSVRFAFLKVLNNIEDCVYARVELCKGRFQSHLHFQN